MESRPLGLVDLPVPRPGPGEILVKVSACGVCHTELDEIEGRVQVKLPIVLGHEIVGRVESLGPGATNSKPGIEWELPGYTLPAANAASAWKARKTYVLSSRAPAVGLTVAMLNIP